MPQTVSTSHQAYFYGLHVACTCFMQTIDQMKGEHYTFQFSMDFYQFSSVTHICASLIHIFYIFYGSIAYLTDEVSLHSKLLLLIGNILVKEYNSNRFLTVYMLYCLVFMYLWIVILN